ncbi:hypothetical protein J6R97_07330 [bacterium]|nr:hypothetical protein [bacterium]
MNVSNYWQDRIDDTNRYIEELGDTKKRLEQCCVENKNKLKSIQEAINSKLARWGLPSVMHCNPKQKMELSKLLGMQSELQYNNIASNNCIFSLCNRMFSESLRIGDYQNNLILSSYIERA